MYQPLINLIVFALISIMLFAAWRYGRTLLNLIRRNRDFAARVLREDLLKYLMESRLHGADPIREDILQLLRIGETQLHDIIADLERHGMLTAPSSALQLSANGEEYALRIIRAHRLYERYLADETGYRETEWHSRADEHEHNLTDSEISRLARKLGNPTHDPHGDPIPAQDGFVAYHKDTVALTEVDAAAQVRIVHLEDEPEQAYRELVSAGLASGQIIRILGKERQHLTLICEGREVTISDRAAANVTVVTAGVETDHSHSSGISLASIPPGQHVRVLRLSQRLRGSERRRLLDLGLLPGTRIGVEMRSPGGDPVAYDIRGALIALRREQAEMILVEAIDSETEAEPSAELTMEKSETAV